MSDEAGGSPSTRANSIRLLEDTHSFPCAVMVKVIGRTDDNFVARIVTALRICQNLEVEPEYRVRETPNGRHVAITFEPFVETAFEVLAIYEHIRAVEGVVMLL